MKSFNKFQFLHHVLFFYFIKILKSVENIYIMELLYKQMEIFSNNIILKNYINNFMYIGMYGRGICKFLLLKYKIIIYKGA